MIRNRLTAYGTLATLILPIAMGCLGREETIRISRDGAVTIALRYEGSADDMKTADALPSDNSGWDVTTIAKKEGDEGNSDEKLVLTSERTFAPGEVLPTNYAGDNDPDADLVLQFPTTLRIERRPDGVYYSFHRVYTARRWAYVQHWNDVLFDDDIKQLTEKPAEELTRDEQAEIIQAFAGVEACKQIEFAKTALLECEPNHRPETWLLARRALLDVYENEYNHFDRLIELCEDLSEDDRNECFEREGNRILGEGYTALVDSLQKEAGFSADRIAQFERAYKRAERYYKITGETGGHHFEIHVAMPGKIVAHNGDEVDTDDDDNVSTVTWQFVGNAFRDRPHELLVVSRTTDGLDHRSKGTTHSHGR